MAQNSGPFLVSSHGHPSFNPRLPSSSSTMSPSLKRPLNNGLMPIGNLPNTTSVGPNMNVSSTPSSIRPTNSMGLMKPGTVSMNPMDKSNSMPYSSRYTRKPWPMSRSMHDKNIRGHDEHESSYLRSNLANHDNINGSSFTIEPAADDDESDDIYFSSRHMAAGRFQRNQRLLLEIYNEVCLPDLRSNVSVDRILTLRKQVDALKTHRETFEKDLNELEEKHAEKKRKFLDSTEKFHQEYIEASSTNLSQEKINEIIQKYETMEKLQKEKQLLAQQQHQQQHQQTTSASVPSQPTSTTATPSPPSTATTTTVSEPTLATPTKTEPVLPTGEVPPQETTTTTPTPPPPPVQTQLPPSQPAPPPPLPVSQPVPSHIPSPQYVSNQVPPSQPVPTPQMPSSQPPIQSQIPVSQPMPPQLPPQQMAPPIMQQASMQPQPTPQTYPMMHSGGGYAPTPGYGHPQQAQYRPPINQRPAQYPSNMQWQQQQSAPPPHQQQWQTNAYDPRYYNAYASNVQWSQSQQQPQQWSSAPSQPQMGAMPHQQQAQMRGPPQQQQPPPSAQMYGNGVHYGYNTPTAPGWNTGGHPSQQYGYPPNPSYDPSLMPSQQQQHYYSSQPMHNPQQVYDYGLPPSQQQQQQPQMPPTHQVPPPAPQMN